MQDNWEDGSWNCNYGTAIYVNSEIDNNDNPLEPDPYTKYILFCAQEANFQTRTILIPYEEFIKVRKEDYELLKKYSRKNVNINGVCIDNLLIRRVIWNNRCGSYENTEWGEAADKLAQYAFDLSYDIFHGDDEDKEWYYKSFKNLATGFDHVSNYKELLDKYNVVDSFLVLEQDVKNNS